MLYKNTITLSWVQYVQNLYDWIGMSKSNIEKLWPSTPIKKFKDSGLPKFSPYQKLREHRHHHLLAADSTDKLSETFRGYHEKELRWQRLTANNAYLRASSSEWVDVSLHDWISEIFIRTSTEIYWGKSVFRVAPQLVTSLRKWERCNWKFLYNLPTFLSKDTATAKNELIQGFTTYFGLPKSQRLDAMTPVGATEDDSRNLDFKDSDIAKINMLWHWA